MSAITVEEFVNKIGFSVDQSQLTRAQNQVNTAVTSMGSGFSWILGKLAPLAAGYGIMQIGTYAVQSAAQMERLTAQFGVMLQSATAGEKMVADIQKLAASTPLTSMGVSESVKTLLAFGVAGKDAIETVRMLGDVAGGDQERLSRLALAYGQTMSAGRLMGQDLLQYINVGFNPLKVIGENLDKFGLKMGTTQNDLRDMMSKGQISADMVSKAFQMATSAGGMFYQNMEKQSKTLGGLWSTMVDNIQLSLIKAIQPLIPMMKQLVDFVGKIDWTPIVQGIQAIAAGLIFLSHHMEIVKAVLATILALMTASYGAAMYARIMQTTIAMQMFGTAGVGAWTSIKTAMLGAVSPLTGIIALLGVAYYAYQKINEAADQRQKDEEMLAANNAMMEKNKQLNDLQAEKIRLKGLVDSKDPYFEGSAGSKQKATYLAQLKEIERQYDLVKKQYSASIAVLGDTSERINGPDAFSKMAQDQWTNNVKNTKQQTVNLNNTVEQHITVDDKGDTKMSRSAVEDITKIAIRSALQVQTVSLSRVPA